MRTLLPFSAPILHRPRIRLTAAAGSSLADSPGCGASGGGHRSRGHAHVAEDVWISCLSVGGRSGRDSADSQPQQSGHNAGIHRHSPGGPGCGVFGDEFVGRGIERRGAYILLRSSSVRPVACRMLFNVPIGMLTIAVQGNSSASERIRRMLHKHMTATLPDDHEA